MRILMVEDDRKTAAYVKQGFSDLGHVCDVVEDGADGLFHATREPYDVIVADRMLPGIDGLSMVKALRAAGRSTPVIFLTSVGGIDDRVEGLDAGGDDYLVKPFAFSELAARVAALMRRPPFQEQQNVLKVHDLAMDLITRRVTRAGQEIELQPKEFLLLEVLVRAKDRVLTRAMLLEKVWDFHFDPQTSVVETDISRLRAKIDKPFGQSCCTRSGTLDIPSVRRVELFRSSGVRTAFLFLILFLVAAALAGTSAFLIIRQELTDRHVREVDREFTFLADLYKSKSLTSLINALDASESTAQGKTTPTSCLGRKANGSPAACRSHPLFRKTARLRPRRWA